ncbi:MAG: hypothetical protein RI601_12225 [Desulfurivibrionaceae bacterium]|nr:hypothetical protein [Desulfurivibrionaceae bacterium]
MTPSKRSISICFFIAAALLLTPWPGAASTPLEIFYSNDVSGQTEPCG